MARASARPAPGNRSVDARLAQLFSRWFAAVFTSEPITPQNIPVADINPYAAPEQTGPESRPYGAGGQDPPVFFPVGITKLYVMCVCTFGLYGIFWFERQFRYYSAYTRTSMMPIWRGIFSIFFAHSLFRSHAHEAQERDLSTEFNANALATIYVVIVLGGRLLQRGLEKSGEDLASLAVTLATVVASVVPLAAAQRVANKVIAADDPRANMNTTFSVWNIITLAICAAPFALILFGVWL